MKTKRRIIKLRLKDKAKKQIEDSTLEAKARNDEQESSKEDQGETVEVERAITLSAAGHSERGPRMTNQDSFGIFGTAACVCDGVGGSDRGGDAAHIACNVVLKTLADGCEPEEAALAAHRSILEHREFFRNPSAEHGLTAETTLLVATWSDDGRMRMVSVGDSRAFRFRDGVCTPITGTGRPDPMSNRLEAALGADMDLEPFVRRCELQLEPGDRVALCTDGVWDRESCCEWLAQCLGDYFTPDCAAINISTEAAASGDDNASVVVVYCD